MRRIVAGVAVAIAVMAIASPAQAQGSRDCRDEYNPNGHSVVVFCDRGAPGRFQAVAHCSNDLGLDWEQHGTVGQVRGTPSFAECTSPLGFPQIDDYHVRWL